MKITFPSYLYRNTYYWYFLRMVQILVNQGIITSHKTDDKFLYTHFVSVVFFDDQPVILDLRDDHALPLPEIDKYPNALIFKANYSSELWDNPPETYEYPIKDEERKHRNKIRQFVFGRGLIIPYEANELQYFKYCIKPIIRKIVSYTGTGIFRQQTESRIKFYDLVSEIFKEKCRLVWYDRRDHSKNDWPEYDARRQKYLDRNRNSWDYEGFLKFLSQGQYSLNFPGIACSQPFRFIDGIIAERAVISTKIWIDAWKMFPCLELPICGYFGTGDWDKAKINLEQLITMPTDSDSLLIDAMKRWYNHRLSPEGMYNNQFLKGLNETT